MKKTIIALGFALPAALFAMAAGAQTNVPVMGPGMMGWYPYGTYGAPAADATGTAAAPDSAEAAEGQAIAGQLQAGQISCSDLTQSDFQALGEYYMGSMMGAWDSVMDQQMGAASDAMHIAMGERFSGCYPSTAAQGGWSTPWGNNNYGYMPMMNWGYGGYGPMMGYGYGYDNWGPLGFLFGIFWIAVLIVVLVLLIRWVRSARHGGSPPYRTGEHHSAMSILKERYAKGEIDRKEFEEKKKDIEG